jgi:serralysin
MNGNAGDDTMNGGAGVDIVIGGAGNDHMFGNEDDDVLAALANSITSCGVLYDLKT